MSIESIRDIQTLATRRGVDWKRYGNVNVRESPCGDLLIFSYNQAAMYRNTWNFFERVSRGLIINRKTGEIVARPFDKFFNMGERPDEEVTRGDSIEVTEKMDGSLGILYRHEGRYKIATRGSFTSEQAYWATSQLQGRDLDIDDDHTLLFEIIYPQNRIVVDYGDRAELVLIGVRNRITGEDYPLSVLDDVARRNGFAMPHIHIASLSEVRGLVATMRNAEGVVVRWPDGYRLKVKGEVYKALAKITDAYDRFERHVTTAAMAHGAGILDLVPEESQHLVRGVVERIGARRNDLLYTVSALAMESDNYETRKDFAIAMREREPRLFSAIMASYSGKDPSPAIAKIMQEEFAS